MKKLGFMCAIFFLFINMTFTSYAKKSKEFVPLRLKDKINNVCYAVFEGFDGAYVYRPTGGYKGNVVIPKEVEIEEHSYNVVGFLKDTFKESNDLISLDIRCNVKCIRDFEFYHCRKLESVKLHDGLLKIGKRAFASCYKLTEIEIANSVCVIEDSAFSSCYNLYQINLPENLSYLGEWAFSNCYNLKSIVIPPNVERIEQSTFEECVNLEKITFNQNLKKICERAFYRCNNLESPEFPKNLSHIAVKAFALCTNIRELTFNSNIECLGWDSFEFCTNINCIKFLGSNPPTMGESVFYLPENFKEFTIDVSIPIDGVKKYKKSLRNQFGCANVNLIVDDEVYP